MFITNSLQLTNKERASLETQVAEALYTRILVNISAFQVTYLKLPCSKGRKRAPTSLWDDSSKEMIRTSAALNAAIQLQKETGTCLYLTLLVNTNSKLTS